MTLRLVLRTLAAAPVRSAVLCCGFGFGIAVMATLLGVGQVVLEQARSPALRGGGDLVVVGGAGPVTSARFVLSSVLAGPALEGDVAAASPSSRATLYLVQAGDITPVAARAGIPSLERALRDPETSQVAGWSDAPADRAWTHPEPGELLRAMDRFHPIPDAPEHEESWAEWLYFNGSSADGAVRFYLTFLAGPRAGPGRRAVAVRLQLERAGRTRSFARGAEIAEELLLAGAPDLEIGGSRVRLSGTRYLIRLDLPAEAGGPGVRGELALQAVPGRSLPPFAIRGARGWVSGYTAPVLGGPFEGTLQIGAEQLSLDGGTGYHDHNWGFWRGVTWEWGQVAHEGLSLLYGRLRPPPDVADPQRVPAILAAFDSGGPLGFVRGATIEHSPEEDGGQPRSIRVLGAGAGMDVRMDLELEPAVRTRMRGPWAEGVRPVDFLQMRAVYTVEARIGDRLYRFTAPGAAETFRGEP